jgi:hypothetical protein
LRTIGKATGIAATTTPSISDSLKSLMQWGTPRDLYHQFYTDVCHERSDVHRISPILT